MFSTFCTIYPRKTEGWKLARISWDKALAAGYTEEEIISGTKTSIANWIVEEKTPGFIPMAATYLNQHRFTGGLSIDITALSKKPYPEWTDAEWRYGFAMDMITDYAKGFMPDHMKRELFPRLEIV